jgi:ABC-type spermidine/putrescine transport system permease subunit II
VSTEVRPPEAAGAPDASTAAPAARARRRPRRRIGLYVAATLLALWVVVPMYLITLLAFRPPAGVYRFPQSLLPTNLSLETMRFFLGYAGLLDALLRSLAVAAITLVLALVIGTPAGYALARFAFRGRSAYRLVILSTRASPVVILSIPLAVFFLRLGLDDSIWAVAAVHTALALPFTVLITASVFVSVPPEFEEAAQTMGCTRRRRLRPGGAAPRPPRAGRRGHLHLRGLLERGVRGHPADGGEPDPAGAGVHHRHRVAAAVPVRGRLVPASPLAPVHPGRPALPARLGRGGTVMDRG